MNFVKGYTIKDSDFKILLDKGFFPGFIGSISKRMTIFLNRKMKIQMLIILRSRIDEMEFSEDEKNDFCTAGSIAFYNDDFKNHRMKQYSKDIILEEIVSIAVSAWEKYFKGIFQEIFNDQFFLQYFSEEIDRFLKKKRLSFQELPGHIHIPRQNPGDFIILNRLLNFQDLEIVKQFLKIFDYFNIFDLETDIHSLLKIDMDYDQNDKIKWGQFWNNLNDFFKLRHISNHSISTEIKHPERYDKFNEKTIIELLSQITWYLKFIDNRFFREFNIDSYPPFVSS